MNNINKSSLKETIYSPQLVPNGIIPFYKEIFQNLIKGNELGKQLFIRDVKAQYRQSFLGIFWAFAPAFVTALLWIFLTGAKVISVKSTGIPIALFIVSGTFLWQIITIALNNTLNCVNSGKPLLTKLNFPREALLIHAIYNTLFNVSILSIVVLIFAPMLGWHPTLTSLFFPFIIIDLVMVGFSLGLFFLAIFSLIADFSRFISIGLQLLMYISAVIFPKPSSPGIALTIFNLNPFTHLIVFSRDILVGIPIENPIPFGIFSVLSLILLLLSLLAFRITMPIVIERLGS